MKKALHIALIFALLFPQLAVLIAPVSADDPWCYEFLNGDGKGVLQSVQVDGGTATYDAENDRFVGGASGTSAQIYIHLQTENSFTLTSVEQTYTINQYGSHSGPTNYLRDLNSLPELATRDDTMLTGTFTISATGLSLSTDGLGFRVAAYGTSQNHATSYLTHLMVCGTGDQPPELGGVVGMEGLVRPLASLDEDDWGVYETTQSDEFSNPFHSVFAMSTSPGKLVFAILGGEVTTVEALSQSVCDERLWTDLTNCAIDVPNEIHGEGGGTWEYALKPNLDPIYRVVIHYESLDIEYFVTDANQYIRVGDTINAGCYLGKTVRMKKAIGAGFANQGVAVITIFDTTLPGEGNEQEIEFVSSLLSYPVPENACNVDPAYSTCIGDAQLADPQQWMSFGTVTWNAPGATLGGYSYISVPFNLDGETSYSMTVAANILNKPGTGALRIQLGQTVEEFTIDSDTDTGVVANYTIPLASHVPDAGLFYTVAVNNDSPSQVELLYICVTAGNPNLTPGSCYFNNYSFDFGTTNWNPTGDVYDMGGALMMTSGATISQNADLLDADPGPDPYPYYISIKTALSTTPLYNPTEPDLVSTVEMEFEYPDEAGFENALFGSGDHATFWDYDYNLPDPDLGTIPDHTVTFLAEIDVTADLSGSFTLTPTITTTNEDVQGVEILEVCIHDLPDVYFTGPPDATGYNSACALVTRPTSNSVPEWINYHWKQLNRFFYCDLMVILARIKMTLENFFLMVGWAIRWAQSSIIMATDWLGTDLFPWLEGHLYNLAVGQVVHIDDGEGGYEASASIGSDIWNWVTGGLKDIVEGIVNGIINALRQLFGWIIDAVNFIFSALIQIILAIAEVALNVLTAILDSAGQAIGKIASFINAWNNAEPHAIAGLPQCEINPKESSFCIVLWMLENTVFSGRGAILPYLLVFAASVELMIWWLGRLEKTIEKTSQST